MFNNYDSWLEQPYQDQYAKEEREDYIEEHTEYLSSCCGVKMPPEYAEAGEYFHCPECHEITLVVKVTPSDMEDI